MPEMHAWTFLPASSCCCSQHAWSREQQSERTQRDEDGERGEGQVPRSGLAFWPAHMEQRLSRPALAR